MFTKKQFYVLITFFFLLSAFRSDMPAYQLYNQKGKRTNFKRLVKEATKADIVFFGELHNNPISHWLQLELTQALYEIHGSQLVLGAEMVETDNQEDLNLYLADQIDADSLKASARLWANYQTDYKPLVELAKTNNLKFIGTNVPRRYASLVFRGGFEVLDTLPDTDKQWIAPLPIDYDPNLPSYLEMMEMMGGMGAGHANPNLPKAQAIKDATMAHFTLENWAPGKLVIHYNGAYHSDNFEGIVWYLKNQNPDLKIVTITTVEQVEIDELEEENTGTANFTICVPEDMTKTY